MFEIFADTRRLRVCKKEKITTTSAGINCLVKFSTDYVGHAIKLVFQINGKRWTVETQYNADGSTIRIPNDCFLPTTSPAWSPLNCELTCALRGEYIVEGGTTVTSRLPTVYTSMGIVEQGYDDTGAMTETAPTPSQVTQLETLVANCLSSAQMYTNMASNSATSASNSAAIASSYAHMLSCMTVSAVGTAAGSTPTVTVNTVGNVYNFKFGIPKGETGATGPQGPAGADGRDGVDGADGIQGPQGPMGPAGRDGRDGTDGTNGRDGIDGQDGRDGVDGATGPQGPAGPTGPTGPEGPQGPIGPQGPEGPIKVTYHFVYGTIPAGASNPTLAEVDTWLRDANQIHVIRYKATDSEVYKDFLYNYSNSSYHYFGGSNGLTKTYGCRIRRTGDTAGQWASSGTTLAQETDLALSTDDTFIATYSDTASERTSLSDIEAAHTAGKRILLDARYNVGGSGDVKVLTGEMRYVDDYFYWYFMGATNVVRYITLRRTTDATHTAGDWSSGTATLQNSNKLAQTITGNESSTELYPTTKAVADYVADKTTFKATYGTTTWAEVDAAYTSGKLMFVTGSGYTFPLQYVTTSNGHNNYYFGTIYNFDWQWRNVSTNEAGTSTSWSSGHGNVQAIANRTDNIEAYATDSTKYPSTKGVVNYVPINNGNTFIAEYGTTNYDDVINAIDAGKTVFCKWDYGGTKGIATACNFSDLTSLKWYGSDASDRLYYIILTSSGAWSKPATYIQPASNRVNTIIGNETETNKYPSTKAVADYVANRIPYIEYEASLVDVDSAYEKYGLALALKTPNGLYTGLSVSTDYYIWHGFNNSVGIRRAYIRRTGANAGTWTNSETYDFQRYANRKDTIVGNETSTVYYPSTKAVADYVADKQQIYYVTYGTDTFSDLKSKFESGIDLILLRNNKKYTVSEVSNTRVTFICTAIAYIYTCYVEEGGWSSGYYNQIHGTANCNTYTSGTTIDTYTTLNNTTFIVPASDTSTVNVNLIYGYNNGVGSVMIDTSYSLPTFNFIGSSSTTIRWATGSAPTFALNHTYEISWKCFRSKILCVFKDWGES